MTLARRGLTARYQMLFFTGFRGRFFVSKVLAKKSRKRRTRGGAGFRDNPHDPALRVVTAKGLPPFTICVRKIASGAVREAGLALFRGERSGGRPRFVQLRKTPSCRDGFACP